MSHNNKEDVAYNLRQHLKVFEADLNKNKKKVQEHRNNIGKAKNFSVLTDDEISLVLAYRANQIRLDQNKKQVTQKSLVLHKICKA